MTDARQTELFTATDRFDLTVIAPDAMIHTVRPRSYVQNARFIGYTGPTGSLRSLSNRDHLTLEILIAVCGQSDPRGGRPLHSVPVSAVLSLLPFGTLEKDLKASLDRLTRTKMALDRVPMGAWAKTMAPIRPGYDQPIAESRSEVSRAGIPALPQRAGIRTGGAPASAPRYRMGESARRYLDHPHYKALIALDPIRVTTPADLAPSDAPLTLTPLRRWAITNGVLAFDLCPYLRFYVRRDRTRRMSSYDDGVRRVPWIHLDLGRMRAFKGAPTICLFRHLTDRIGWSKKPRSIDLSMGFEEIAELTSLRLQKTGSIRGQVENAVLKAASRDFAESAGEFTISMKWRGDDGAFLDRVIFRIETQLPDLSRLRSRRITDDGRDNLTSDDRLFVARPDVPELRVKLSTWAKVRGLYGPKLSGLIDLSTAFDIAIDEMLFLEGKGGLVPLSARFNERRYRGPGLRAAIDSFGVDRACLLFVTEEMWDPDLTDEFTRRLLRYSRIERLASETRVARLEGHRRKRAPAVVELSPPPQGFVEDRMADYRRSLEIEAEKARQLAESREEWRAAKKSVQRDENNSRRRAVRAERNRAKADLQHNSRR
ncbi:hypothetical protein [Aureimonas mangrovi]|uniref:hypothetical protein n=1 Tax=Aureimonas mangrovi TaxID=2758041 RepID=UPI00163D51EF|nr:hypothetical protein [Aureimonas mangrovi]